MIRKHGLIICGDINSPLPSEKVTGTRPGAAILAAPTLSTQVHQEFTSLRSCYSQQMNIYKIEFHYQRSFMYLLTRAFIPILMNFRCGHGFSFAILSWLLPSSIWRERCLRHFRVRVIGVRVKCLPLTSFVSFSFR